VPRSLRKISRSDYQAETISLRQLTKHASELLRTIEERGRPATVTRLGKPVAFLVPLAYAKEHLPTLLEEFDPRTGRAHGES
jgi:prevent-host-death family protein